MDFITIVQFAHIFGQRTRSVGWGRKVIDFFYLHLTLRENKKKCINGDGLLK